MNLFDSWRRRDATVTNVDETVMESALIEAYAAPIAPNLTWGAALNSSNRPASAAGVGVRRPGARKLGFGLAFAASAVAAVAITLPMGGGGGTQAVSAQEIIDRSIAAVSGQSAALDSFHMVVEYDYGNGSPARTSETWRDGESRWRTESRTTGSNGPSVFGSASNGTHAWLYMTEGDVTRASRGDASVFEGRTGMAPAGENLEGVVTTLMMPGCQEATLDGMGSALGRAVHVVRIEPTGVPCEGGKLLNESAVAWIDAETFMLLRVERTNHESGQVVTTNVTLFETGVPEPSAFVYEAPEGVQVVDASDYDAMKVAISGN